MSTRLRAEIVLDAFIHRYPLLYLAFRRTPTGLQIANYRLLVVHSCFLLFFVFAGVVDDTFDITDGRGVRDHYGFHALLLSAPALVYLCCWLMSTIARIIADPRLRHHAAPAVGIGSLREELCQVALRRSAVAVRMLWYFRSVGFAALVANAASTRYPLLIYGQDVFDSSSHITGYIAGRIFLAYYFVYLLPYVAYFIYVAVSTTVSIVRHVRLGTGYDLRCFASDGCGGFKNLGQLMIIAVYMYLPIVMVIVALSHTHRNFYPTLALSAILALLVPAQLFLPFLQLHRMLASLKSRRLHDLEQLLTKAEIALLSYRANDPRLSSQAQLPDMPLGSYLRLIAGNALYKQTVALSTWPYVRADVMKWISPFIPIVTSVVLRRYGVA